MKQNRSRLAKRLEKQSRKNLTLSILGILIVLFVLIKFGLPFLVNFSLFLSGGKTEDAPKKNNNVFIAPPFIDSLPTATNSAGITISGTSFPKYNIQLYINDTLNDQTETQKDGSFSFKETLSFGENTIKAKATLDGKSSDFSQSSTVVVSNTPPKLEVTNPSDKQSFLGDHNFVEVKGATSDGTRVTVNNFWAIIDEKNNFSYRLNLQNGENKIKIVATDQAGNKAEKELIVTYSL